LPKLKTDDDLAELHKAIMDAVRDYRRPTPAARRAVEDALNAYRAAWLGEESATGAGGSANG